MTSRISRAAARRLQHRSRGVWSSTAVAVLMLVGGALCAVAIMAVIGVGDTTVWFDAAVAAFTEGATAAIVVAAAFGILAVFCLWGALVPGRTGRRVLERGRIWFVIDDAVVAGAVSRRVGREAAVGPRQVNTRVSRRRADIELSPSMPTRSLAPVVTSSRRSMPRLDSCHVHGSPSAECSRESREPHPQPRAAVRARCRGRTRGGRRRVARRRW